MEEPVVPTLPLPTRLGFMTAQGKKRGDGIYALTITGDFSHSGKVWRSTVEATVEIGGDITIDHVLVRRVGWAKTAPPRTRDALQRAVEKILPHAVKSDIGQSFFAAIDQHDKDRRLYREVLAERKLADEIAATERKLQRLREQQAARWARKENTK